MSFTAVMPGSGRVCAFRVPTVHGKSRVSTSNHEPAGGIRSQQSTDLTPEFLQCCHGSVPSLSVAINSHAHWRSKLVGDLVSECPNNGSNIKALDLASTAFSSPSANSVPTRLPSRPSPQFRLQAQSGTQKPQDHNFRCLAENALKHQLLALDRSPSASCGSCLWPCQSISAGVKVLEETSRSRQEWRNSILRTRAPWQS